MVNNSESLFPAVKGLIDSTPTAADHPLVKTMGSFFQLWGFVQLDDALDQNARTSFNVLLDKTIDKGVNKGSEADLKALHFALDELLRLRFVRAPNKLELSTTLFEAQQKIIKAVYAHDAKEAIEQGGLNNIRDFSEWYTEKCKFHTQHTHPLFAYIGEEAGIEGFKYFAIQEAGVHVAFDDVLAFAQVGVHGGKRVEFFHNLEDELGNGDPSKFHMTVFGRLLKELDITQISKRDLTWQSLACGNYMMFLSHFRSFYYESVGYLGLVEAAIPSRFSKVTQAGKRLGISSNAMEFHSSHSELDVEHAQGWFDKIVMPEVNDNPAAAKSIATGVLLREAVSKRYWDALLENCRTADAAAATPNPVEHPALQRKGRSDTPTPQG